MMGATMRDIILLSSNSSETVFYNKEYVSNIEILDTMLEFETNREGLTSNKTC